MKYRDLRDFMGHLERQGECKRIGVPVGPSLEVTEICDRTLRAGGPALLFEHPKGSQIPLLAHLLGPCDAWRWAWAPRKGRHHAGFKRQCDRC